MFDWSLLDILITLPGILLGLSVHEYAHARIAYLLGDSTAADDGRMTLDCSKHIDPIGFLFIIIAGFGWAKPVLINPELFKNPKRDEILVSLAGPFGNFVLAFVFFLISKIIMLTMAYPYTGSMHTIMRIILSGALINLGLFVFNLIPIPPLDGSHLYMAFLRKWNKDLADQISRLGFAALILIIMIDNRTGMDLLPITPLMDWFADKMQYMVGL